MKVFPVELTGLSDLSALINKIRADRRSFPWFRVKTSINSLYIKDLSTVSANILKQEILSRGGDLVVSQNTVNCRDKTTDGLLLATEKQLVQLIGKLEEFDIPSLVTVREELADRIARMKIRTWKMELGNGRPPLILDSNTRIMGIINLTPDSFFPKSRTPAENIRDKAASMIQKGASVIDLGAESTRPGSLPITAEEEIKRLVPPLKILRSAFPELCISVDTYRSETAQAALQAGADIINDIYGLAHDPELADVVARKKSILVIGHIQGTPKTMQDSPFYNDTVLEVLEGLESSLETALKGGITEDRIIIDPGLGFGKRYSDNLAILKNIESFRTFGLPLLIGHSRKGFTGKLAGSDTDEARLGSTASISSYCAMKEVQMVRVHDIEENYRAIRTITEIREARL
jgi:dihydropteroate synthase